MRRAGWVAAAAALAVGALALSSYRDQDYRSRFARMAGELVAVRDSTGVAFLPDGTRVTDVTLVSDAGFRVRARVRSPGLQDGVRRPAMIVIGGYKTGRAVVEVPDSTSGLVLASVEYPYDVRNRPRGLSWLWRFPGVRRAMLDTPPAILLLAQYLYTRDDVDPDRVTVLGASIGAPLAVAAAATDRRIAGVALVHGGGDIKGMLAGVLEPAWTVPLASRLIALGLAPLEPTRYAGMIAPRPLLMLNATDDEMIPRKSALALYHSARRPKHLVWYKTRHVALSERGVINDLLDEVLAWMRERGLR
jgi:fermentation-respiration switch protein FrsA (DUF1100 family)